MRFAVCAALALASVFPQSFAAPDVARMEEIVQSFVKGGQFSGTVLVAEDGKIVFDKGYGYANREWLIPNAPDVKFRLGSITKQFTAASIFLLQERGKLAISDPVKKYLPDVPAAWDKITIYNLLTHTSGIPNYTDDHYAELRPLAVTPEQLMARFKDKPLDFAPGSKGKYSNSGYIVLGILIEKISGMPYAKFLEDNIFKPVGVADSGYDSAKTITLHRAAGYVPSPNGVVNADYLDMSVPFSAGALYSTTHDLLKWEEALFGGKVVSAASLKTMTTPFKNDYGCGLAISKVADKTDINHGGGIDGFNTQIDYVPSDKLTVAVLGNQNGTAPGEIARMLVRTALGEKAILPAERQATKIDPATFDALAGTYQLAPKFAISFSREGEHLFAQGTGQPKIEIFPESDRKFFAKVVDAEVTFETDAQSHATKVVLHQNGRDTPGVRVEGKP